MESLVDIVAAAWQLVDIPGFDIEDLLKWRQGTSVGVCLLLAVLHSYAASFGRVFFLTDPIVTRVEQFIVRWYGQWSSPSRHVPFRQSHSFTEHRSIQPLCLYCRINS